jgi:hypothetical protein
MKATSLSGLLALVAVSVLPSVVADDPKVQIDVTVPASCTRKSQNDDTLSVHYRGTLQANGVQFDSSYGGQPFKFQLGAGQVIKGWDQGLLDMCIGESRNLTIPPELGYGSRGSPGAIPPNAVLSKSIMTSVSSLTCKSLRPLWSAFKGSNLNNNQQTLPAMSKHKRDQM